MNSKYKALILEDESHNIWALTDLLSEYKQIEIAAIAEDGIEAENLCSKILPDIFFADIDVPRKNGFSVAEEASRLGILCIFTTRMTNYALKAYKIGAIGYLNKPYHKEELDRVLATVFQLLKNKRDPNYKEQPASTLPAVLQKKYKLSPAEIEMAMTVYDGCIRENLPSTLGKSERAVKALLQRTYAKTVNLGKISPGPGRADKYAQFVYFLFDIEKKLK